ncbi:cytochrome c oxidase subunit 3 [Catalinimonas alkaloidigena]|uniref:Cytochrome c oxidase subunit 3 n=1 Tax=Catalinimonas alkaloidigena TaxID=1075417 RepID=A0A1G9EPM7_9BACT|nr:cytochrome c oxidase subunit 3 [Catalinimonas alkaloidigena]SDK78096.1 cytochrome c oxidase subunit 3 [Catalinimonas alkaloidigena]
MRSTLYARRDPYQLMIYLGMLGSALIFLFLSVVYVLRKGGAQWETFALPRIFWLTTAAIMISSFTLTAARRAFHREKFLTYRLLLSATFVLALVFAVGQVLGGQQLLEEGITLQGNTAGAFVYLFSGLHLAHVLGGMLVVAYALVDGWRHHHYVDSFLQTLNPVKVSRLRLVNLYWHFVDVLWLYLFGFLLYHQL